MTQSDTTREPKTTEFPQLDDKDYGEVDLEFANSRYIVNPVTSDDIRDWWNLREGFVSGMRYKEKEIANLKHALSMYAGTNKDCSITGYDAEAFGDVARKAIE